jgi:hypothetical protein
MIYKIGNTVKYCAGYEDGELKEYESKLVDMDLCGRILLFTTARGHRITESNIKGKV